MNGKYYLLLGSGKSSHYASQVLLDFSIPCAMNRGKISALAVDLELGRFGSGFVLNGKSSSKNRYYKK